MYAHIHSCCGECNCVHDGHSAVPEIGDVYPVSVRVDSESIRVGSSRNERNGPSGAIDNRKMIIDTVDSIDGVGERIDGQRSIQRFLSIQTQRNRSRGIRDTIDFGDIVGRFINGVDFVREWIYGEPVDN